MTGEAAALRQRFGPAELEPLLMRNGVDATVLVQTVSDVAETREFLETAAETEFVRGVVGWVDLTTPDVADTLDALRTGPGGEYLVGLRHQVHDEADPDWLRRADVGRGLTAVAEAGLAYDLLVRPRELAAADAVARRFPSLRFVVDHIAKPPIATGEIDGWARAMRAFADQPHVACKLSGMVTEAGADWSPDGLRPYVATVLDIFGEDRVMFGSDWPVCTLVASYDDVVAALRAVLASLGVLTPSFERKLFHANAAHWYDLAG